MEAAQANNTNIAVKALGERLAAKVEHINWVK
jgi:hypothetical protein